MFSIFSFNSSMVSASKIISWEDFSITLCSQKYLHVKVKPFGKKLRQAYWRCLSTGDLIEKNSFDVDRLIRVDERSCSPLFSVNSSAEEFSETSSNGLGMHTKTVTVMAD